jgi:hypothetical protein
MNDQAWLGHVGLMFLLQPFINEQLTSALLGWKSMKTCGSNEEKNRVKSQPAPVFLTTNL